MAYRKTDGELAHQPPPVDRDKTEQTAPGPGSRGQQETYTVLADEERGRGFVRPVRFSYVHTKCGAVTSMGRKIAETYARDPSFYSGTYCSQCCGHYPVGEHGEFVWKDTDQKVGT